MATTWTIFAFYLLPPPVVIITLLLLPLPRTFQKGLLLFCKKVLSCPFLGTFRIEHFLILVSGGIFGGLSTQYFQKYGQHAIDSDFTPNQKAGYYSGKWRMERNWWIACFAFFAWCVMSRFHQVLLHKIKLQEKVDALEKSYADLKKSAHLGAAGPKAEDTKPSAPPAPNGLEMSDLKKQK